MSDIWWAKVGEAHDKLWDSHVEDNSPYFSIKKIGLYMVVSVSLWCFIAPNFRPSHQFACILINFIKSLFSSSAHESKQWQNYQEIMLKYKKSKRFNI